MFNILKIFSLFVSIIIGAGFASGKELFSFFATQQHSVIYVIVSSTVIFFTVSFATLEISRKNKTTTYSQFLSIIFKNKTMIYFFELCIIFFMFVSFSSMVAGFTSLTTTAFGFSKNFARLIFILLNFIILLRGHDSLVKLSVVLVPLLVLGALVFGYSYIDVPRDVHILSDTTLTAKSIFKGVNYSSYNLITSIAIVCTLSKLYSNKLHNFIASLLVAFVLLFLSVAILIPLFSEYELLQYTDMPIYTLLLLHNTSFVLPYLILMVLATLSTSVANAYAVTLYFSNKFESNYMLTLLLIIFCGVVFSLIGFSNIVNFVYPIFGFFGIIKILKIIKRYLR